MAPGEAGRAIADVGCTPIQKQFFAPPLFIPGAQTVNLSLWNENFTAGKGLVKLILFSTVQFQTVRSCRRSITAASLMVKYRSIIFPRIQGLESYH
jgi:hypothetical protein